MQVTITSQRSVFLIWPPCPAFYVSCPLSLCWEVQVCDDRPDKGAAELATLLPLIPDDRLMIETDAPYLTPRSIT